MARLARAEVFAPDEIACVHVMNRVVRRCFLMGTDSVSGKNYDHRKAWFELELRRLAVGFGIDLIGFAILSNHFHLILRSRPDVVATWDDSVVVRRWLGLCPARRKKDGSAAPPSDAELKSIVSDHERVSEIRSRLSDISWWMRLLCQRIAQRANREDQEQGKFWQSRYRAVRLVDEEALLACSAYVDLNPIRAALAETIEASDHTSAQRRAQALRRNQGKPSQKMAGTGKSYMPTVSNAEASDEFLAPVEIDEARDDLGPRPNLLGIRCSDKGILPMPTAAYLELLDWTARKLRNGKPGSTPRSATPVFERLKIKREMWFELVTQFGRLFSSVAGRPCCVDGMRTKILGKRFCLPPRARELLSG